MTRLKTDDIANIAQGLSAYDAELKAKTGAALCAIACRAAGGRQPILQRRLAEITVGVIPVTLGQGLIGGFCEAVAAIVSHLGCRAFVTRTADVAGLAEAVEQKADVVMLADDDCFVAIHLQDQRVIENGTATGAGFAAGLDLMAGGLEEKQVLVIGCGPVGRSAAFSLVRWGARVSVFDINAAAGRNLIAAIGPPLNVRMRIAANLDTALREHFYIVDATPAAGIIHGKHIAANTYVSAPGVPLGLTAAAQSRLSGRLLHDPLQIGVATMLVSSLQD